MASRSSSDSAGEQRLEMGSWNEKKNEHSREERTVENSRGEG